MKRRIFLFSMMAVFAASLREAQAESKCDKECKGGGGKEKGVDKGGDKATDQNADKHKAPAGQTPPK